MAIDGKDSKRNKHPGLISRIFFIFFIIAILGLFIKYIAIPLFRVSEESRVSNRMEYTVITSPFFLELEVSPGASISFDLTTAFVAPVENAGERRCLNTLIVEQEVEHDFNPNGNRNTSKEFPLVKLCNGNTQMVTMVGFYAPFTIIPENIQKQIATTTIRDTYFYPFDKYEADFNLQVNGELIQDEQVVHYVLEPDLIYDIDANEWQIQVINEGQPDTERNRLHFVLERPLFQRIITAVILISIAFLIVLLITIQERGAILEVTAAVLFSLWSIQPLLIPSNVTWTTVINQIILFNYALLALVLFLRIVVIPAWLRLGHGSSAKLIEKQSEDRETKQESSQEGQIIQQLNEQEVKIMLSSKQPVILLQFITAVSSMIIAWIAIIKHIRNRKVENHWN